MTVPYCLDSEMTISALLFKVHRVMPDQGQGSWILCVGLGYQNRRRYILKYRSHERNTK